MAPHHMLDVVDPLNNFSVIDFRDMSLPIVITVYFFVLFFSVVLSNGTNITIVNIDNNKNFYPKFANYIGLC